MDSNKLPRRRDVICHLNHLRRLYTKELHHPGQRERLAEILSEDILSIWSQCEVPTRPIKEVLKKVRRLMDEQDKHVKSRSAVDVIPNGLALFDVALYSCHSKIKDHVALERVSLVCMKHKKPLAPGTSRPQAFKWTKPQLEFYFDQNTTRIKTVWEVKNQTLFNTQV